KKFFSLFILAITMNASAQDAYRYEIDLNSIQNDQLQVTLHTPKVNAATVDFTFPAIIPGTYKIADYGKFVQNVQAFDNKGKALKVSKKGTNPWRISKASELARISYTLDDIYDAKQEHK